LHPMSVEEALERTFAAGRMPRPSDVAWWRAAVVNIITDAMALVMSPVEYERQRQVVLQAEREHTDTLLMDYLMRYAPDDPHVTSYPG
ncbi:MAG: hypothetical protein ACRDHE_04515, partial [Ktedonobacterales bacterium]